MELLELRQRAGTERKTDRGTVSWGWDGAQLPRDGDGRDMEELQKSCEKNSREGY